LVCYVIREAPRHGFRVFAEARSEMKRRAMLSLATRNRVGPVTIWGRCKYVGRCSSEADGSGLAKTLVYLKPLMCING